MARFDIEEIGLNTEGAHISIVVSRFNQHVVDALLEAALATLKERGIDDQAINIVRVPGAFEIPLVAQRLAKIPGTDAVIVLGAMRGEKVSLLATVSKDLTMQYHAGNIIKHIAPIVGGGGGGRADFAQAGGKDPARLDEALQKVYELIEKGA